MPTALYNSGSESGVKPLLSLQQKGGFYLFSASNYHIFNVFAAVMNYIVKGEFNKRFELFDEEENALGKLDNMSTFLRKWNIVLPSGKAYKLEQAGLLKTAVEVTCNGDSVASMQVNWKGHTAVAMTTGETFLFKKVGIFGNHYGLFTEEEHEIITLKRTFKIAGWSFSFTVNTDDSYLLSKDALLILLSVSRAVIIHTGG